jgi:hypothetical protein
MRSGSYTSTAINNPSIVYGVEEGGGDGWLSQKRKYRLAEPINYSTAAVSFMTLDGNIELKCLFKEAH